MKLLTVEIATLKEQLNTLLLSDHNIAAVTSYPNKSNIRHSSRDRSNQRVTYSDQRPSRNTHRSRSKENRPPSTSRPSSQHRSPSNGRSVATSRNSANNSRPPSKERRSASPFRRAPNSPYPEKKITCYRCGISPPSASCPQNVSN